MKLIPVLIMVIVAVNVASAQKSYYPLNEKELVVWGQGFGVNSFSRLPADVEKKVPAAVWNQSVRSGGIQIRFITNSDSITIRYSLSAPYTANDWFSPTGANGLDLYARKNDGSWNWCHPNTRKIGSHFNYHQLKPDDPSYQSEGYQYVLYLPTFAITTDLSITVDNDAHFRWIPVPAERKPIVVYGTSVAHGSAASRPGNTWVNITSRAFYNYPVVNLGFSGVGKMEPEVIDVVNQLDAEVFILDCLPNFSTPAMPPLVESRYKNAIETLTNSHPKAAILITEHLGYSNMETWNIRKELVEANNAELRKVYKFFRKKGYKNLHYLSQKEMMLDMSADIADYVHPNDKGMYRIGEAYIKKLKKILK